MSHNKVFDLSVYLRHGGREQTQTVLSDLHSVCVCPATVPAEGPVLERKHAHTFNKQVSQTHCGADGAEAEPDWETPFLCLQQ